MDFSFLEGWEEALVSLVQAPIRSEPGDLRALADLADPAAAHPGVEPVRMRWRVRVADELVEERFRFTSPVETGYPRNDAVTGERWRLPEARLSGTALVLVHTAFAPNHRFQRVFARAALRSGAHVFALDMPYHIRRQPRGSRFSGQFLFSGDIPRLIGGFVQGAADVRTLLLTLRLALGYRRVLLAGLGFGGTVAALAAALEPVDGLFLAAPVVDPHAAVWEGAFGEVIRRGAQARGFEEGEVRRAMRCVTPAQLPAPQVERECVRVVYGTDDLLVPMPAISRYLEHLGGPPAEEISLGHTLLALRLPMIQRLIGRWVEEISAGSADAG